MPDGKRQPVGYLQTDPRWGGLDYSAPGEKTTIRASGCGPTALAMVLATWADPKVTPETECAWALANGYKAPHSGTYYGYFVPAAKRYGLSCYRVNWNSLYGNGDSAYHAQVRDALDRRDLVIACMGPGTWTRSGHYVLVWAIEGNTVYVNDPASTKAHRVRGDYGVFRKQVKYYWVVERPEHVDYEEDEEMDIEKMLAEMTEEQAYRLVSKANGFLARVPEGDWSKVEGHWKRAADAGVVDGMRPECGMTRCEVVAVLGRLGVV